MHTEKNTKFPLENTGEGRRGREIFSVCVFCLPFYYYYSIPSLKTFSQRILWHFLAFSLSLSLLRLFKISSPSSSSSEREQERRGEKREIWKVFPGRFISFTYSSCCEFFLCLCPPTPLFSHHQTLDEKTHKLHPLLLVFLFSSGAKNICRNMALIDIWYYMEQGEKNIFQRIRACIYFLLH